MAIGIGILIGVLGNTAFDIIKQALLKLHNDQFHEDQIINGAYRAFERAYERFSQSYAQKYNPRSGLFITEWFRRWLGKGNKNGLANSFLGRE